MEKKQLQVTTEEIQKYLEKNDENKAIMDKEALFVRYLKEMNVLTKEKSEIIEEQNQNAKEISLYDAMDYFSNYMENLKHKNIDRKGIYHLMIPATALYGKEFYFRHSTMIQQANQLTVQFPSVDSDRNGEILRDVVDDYMTVGQLVMPKLVFVGFSEFRLGKQKAEHILEQYEPIYGKTTVEEIKQYVKRKI